MKESKESPQIFLHSIPLKELCQKLETSLTEGLTQKKAQQKNLIFGDNVIPLKEKTHPLLRFFKEITNWFSILLWIGSILAITIYILQPEGNQAQLYLAATIIAIILITGIITYLQTAKSEQIMQKFKDLLPPNCNAIRSGSFISIPAAKLVKGDLVEMKMGERIPADVRIISSLNMKVDNSSITGQTALLLRKVQSTSKNILQSSNVAFLGTYCRHGKGRGIVIGTGKDTYLSTIANLTFQQKKQKSPLQQQLDKFVFMITIIACSLGVVFIILGKVVIGYTALECMVLGIGIIVANVPEGILACVTISLAITAKKLAAKNVLVKNLQSVETLGSTSCICSDKTGTLTMNKMTVKHLWIGETVYSPLQNTSVQDLYTKDKDFKQLVHCSVLSSQARFQNEENNQEHAKLSVIGDASETALIRFCKTFQGVDQLRNVQYQPAKDQQGNNFFLSFNSSLKYSFGVYTQATQSKTNPYKIYMKGAPQKVWKLCTKIRINGKTEEINKKWNNKFDEINYEFANNGERVLGFAVQELDPRSYPANHKFKPLNNDSEAANNKEISMNNLIFLGVISLQDPPKPKVKQAIEKCKSSGVKVIMLTGDQSITALSIGKKIGMITYKTNIDLQKAGYSQAQSMEKANALSINGDNIQAVFKNGHQNGMQHLKNWINKPEIIFSRTTPVHKLNIVQACQQLGYIVGVTGDGVNDAPAIKQASIGISMGISGSDITKDAADMVLLDDDFSSIIQGIEEGRKIFDNLKKTIVYLLTSNMTEILPFCCMIIFRIPLPISSIFMLVICVGTDIYPAIALAYEQPQLDIMTRRPRKATQRLVTIRMMTHAYGQLGIIGSFAGMFNYFVIMEIYGFPPDILLFLLSKNGLVPLDENKSPDHRFNRIVQYNADAKDLGNAFLPQQCSNATFMSGFPTWVRSTNNRFDVRSSYVSCCPPPNQQLYCSLFNWPANVAETISPVTNSRVAFTTQSLYYAQSGYFAAIILVQWLNVFACKSRKLSFTYSTMNVHIFIGILIETIIMILLLQVPHVYNIFGGRPLNWALMGVPGLPLAMLLLVWQQGRKYLINNKPWFQKYIYW